MTVEIPMVDRSRPGGRSYGRLIVGVKRMAEFVLCHVWIFDDDSGTSDNVNEPQFARVARDNVGVYVRNACPRRLTDIEAKVVAVGLVYAIQDLQGTALQAMQFDNLLGSKFSNVNNMAIGKDH